MIGTSRKGVVWMLVIASVLCSRGMAEAQDVLKVGHVGHDHHLALYVAASLGEQLRGEAGGWWLEEVKPRDVYRLRKDGKEVAIVRLLEVGGGSGMPAALARGQIDIGLGGLAPTVAAIDRGAPVKVVAPLNADGDMLVVGAAFPARTWDEFVATVKDSDRPVRVGYKAPTAVALLILLRALEAEGIRCGAQAVDDQGQPVQVMTINLQGGANMTPAMAKGLVDAIVMNQPVPAVIEAKGFGRIAADLRDLPPSGRWHDHPCCCVAATQSAIDSRRGAVEGVLALLLAAGELVRNEPTHWAAVAAPWTHQLEEVERQSIPTVNYVTLPSADWRRGVDVWFEMMDDLDWFKDRLCGLSADERRAIIEDYSLLERAAAQRRPGEASDASPFSSAGPERSAIEGRHVTEGH